MKRKIFILAVCVLGLMTGCEKDTDGSYQAGITDLENENFVGAVENFELAIGEGKYVAEAFRGEGVTYYKMGKYPESLQAFQSALKEVEDDPALTCDILSYMAVVQYELEDYAGSIDSCNKILEIDQDADAYFLRGRDYLYENEYDKAKEDFDKITDLSEEYEDFIHIYEVYEACGLKADGETYLEKALKLSGESEEDLYNRGKVYYYLKDYEKAAEELTASYEKGYKEASVYLGRVYAESGDVKKARAEYEKCLQEEICPAKAYNGLAYCDILEEDYDGALGHIKEGLQTEDQEEKQALLFNEIVAYEKKMDFAAAKEKTAAYLELYPSDEAALKESYFLETR